MEKKIDSKLFRRKPNNQQDNSVQLIESSKIGWVRVVSSLQYFFVNDFVVVVAISFTLHNWYALANLVICMSSHLYVCWSLQHLMHLVCARHNQSTMFNLIFIFFSSFFLHFNIILVCIIYGVSCNTFDESWIFGL